MYKAFVVLLSFLFFSVIFTDAAKNNKSQLYENPLDPLSPAEAAEKVTQEKAIRKAKVNAILPDISASFHLK